MEVAPKVVNGSPSRSELLTVEEVAELLKVPVSWVHEHTRKKTSF
jgi:hypothetical protein